MLNLPFEPFRRGAPFPPGKDLSGVILPFMWRPVPRSPFPNPLSHEPITAFAREPVPPRRSNQVCRVGYPNKRIRPLTPRALVKLLTAVGWSQLVPSFAKTRTQ